MRFILRLTRNFWEFSAKAASITLFFVLFETLLLSLSDKDIWGFFKVVCIISVFLNLSYFGVFWIFY